MAYLRHEFIDSIWGVSYQAEAFEQGIKTIRFAFNTKQQAINMLMRKGCYAPKLSNAISKHFCSEEYNSMLMVVITDDDQCFLF